MTAHARHRFWAALPPVDAGVFKHATGHQQVMDAYLVSLALHHRGRVVTFDGRLKAYVDDDDLVATIPA